MALISDRNNQTTNRVFMAEQNFHRSSQVTTIKSVENGHFVNTVLSSRDSQDMIRQITKTTWWKNRKRKEVAWINSLKIKCTYPYDANINIPMNPMIIEVIHRMSHAIALSEPEPHGPKFFRAYLAMTKRYLGPESKILLQECLKDQGIKLRVWSEDSKHRASLIAQNEKMERTIEQIKTRLKELES